MRAKPKLPPTAHRVAWNTSGKVNADIRDKTLKSMERAINAGDLDGAIRRLDREWDTERVLETNAACLLLLSLGLGVFRNRRWLWLTGGVATFLLQHALQGWCPPLPIIRALGVRTASEIGTERTALQALRGDFDALAHSADAALRAACPNCWETGRL